MLNETDRTDPSLVKSREALADHVNQLARELREHPETWENRSLEGFLEALSAYLRDVPGYLRNVRSPLDPEAPSWELFALVLCGASVYE
ncbi:MAG: DUF7660 family protein [Actinomycetota bacterium]